MSILRKDTEIIEINGLSIVDSSQILGLVVDDNYVVYKCPKCSTTFKGIPSNECMFCGYEFNIIRSEENNDDLDYRLW